jgi:hypothetical protein
VYNSTVISLILYGMAINEVHPISGNGVALMIDNVIAISQKTLDLVKVEPNSDSDAYLMPHHGGNEFISVKVEEDKHIEEEEDPLTLKFPEVKAEREVGTCVVDWVLL